MLILIFLVILLIGLGISGYLLPLLAIAAAYAVLEGIIRLLVWIGGG